jgi:hypothetical protein
MVEHLLYTEQVRSSSLLLPRVFPSFCVFCGREKKKYETAKEEYAKEGCSK